MWSWPFWLLLVLGSDTKNHDPRPWIWLQWPCNFFWNEVGGVKGRLQFLWKLIQTTKLKQHFLRDCTWWDGQVGHESLCLLEDEIGVSINSSRKEENPESPIWDSNRPFPEWSQAWLSFLFLTLPITNASEHYNTFLVCVSFPQFSAARAVVNMKGWISFVALIV